ncbi:MAG: hypothetical protein AB7F09_09995 [Parvibaculaceae bacterium]
MVGLDDDGQGLVTLRFHQPYEAEDEARYLACLARLAEIRRAFRLLTIFGGGPGLSPRGEREQALWYKANRETLKANCRAIAMVRPGASAEMERIFSQLFGCPVLATENEEDGRRFLARQGLGRA